MRSYFHCSTAHFMRHRNVILVLVGSVCAETAVIAFIVMFFGLFGAEGARNYTLTGIMTAAAALLTVAGLAVCFAAAAGAEKKQARHSRYTFLDIQQKSAVVSIYSGEMKVLGKNAVFRELYVISFSELESVTPHPSRRKLVVIGNIRRYGMESDFLGYHIKNGSIDFDRPWLNVGAFEQLSGAVIPCPFGDPVKISEALMNAKKRFDETPKPKKHVFREADFIRRRPIKRLLPDDPDFSRRWK